MSNTAFFYYYQTAEDGPTPPTPAPVYSIQPAITSAAVVNTANVGTRGTASNADSYADQWQSSPDGVGSWADVAGATSLNYTPTPALYNRYLRRRETATGPGGSTVAYSNVSTPVTLPSMVFQVTTTGANQTLTLQELTVTESTNVNWGDGQNNNYTGAGQRTHLYAAAGTYTVTINKPHAVTHFDLRDTKTSSITGGNVSLFRNATNLRFLSITALNWTVGAAAPMPPNLQYLQLELTTGVTWVVNADNPMPPINDVLNLRGMTGLTWAIGPTNVIPVGVESLTIRDCPNVSYAVISPTVPAWKVNDLSIVRIENGWTQAQVDAFLQDVYASFPTRAVGAGTIDLLGGSPANAAPSGVLAAMCPPTTGKARAYELVNDSCGVSANHWTSVTTA